MQAQQNLTNFYLKSSTGFQTQFIRLIVFGIVLALTITVVVLYLAGQAHAAGTVLPHVTGHTHAAHLIANGPGESPTSTPTP